MARKHKNAHSEPETASEPLSAEAEPAFGETPAALPAEAEPMELSMMGEAAIGAADDEDDELEGEDSLTFSNGVIEKIASIAVRDVEGVLGMRGGWMNRVQDAFGMRDARKGVSVEVTPENAVRVNLSVIIEYGSFAPKVFEDVKRVVVEHISGMTGLEVAGVNLRIEDVMTAEEYERMRARRRQEAEEAKKADETPKAPAETEAAEHQG